MKSKKQFEYWVIVCEINQISKKYGTGHLLDLDENPWNS